MKARQINAQNRSRYVTPECKVEEKVDLVKTINKEAEKVQQLSYEEAKRIVMKPAE